MRYQKKETDETIGGALASARKDAELSQIELAKQLGISQRALSSYERGNRSIPVFLIPKICEALNLRPAELLGINEPFLDGRSRTARLLKQVEKIDELTPEKQKIVLALIDELAVS